ncbi:ester cyclase [Tunicatimonas pelagia]|uniref:ester cyclase n=1 Tax=Tunicatimonas pelagia TaxID=931531 RepID=UPI002666153B|nr:ester cyclase [Tunicatimonas pelagia]WKN42433.1 ester cyclase [Tunicatimonas pelagia]
MSEQNKQLVKEYLEAVSGHEKTRDLIDKYVSDQDSELKQHIEVFEAAFPLYRLHIQDLIAEDDKVTVRFRFAGTHKAEFMGMPATGNDVETDGIIIYQLENNKIINHWMQVDAVGLTQQLQAEKAVV